MGHTSIDYASRVLDVQFVIWVFDSLSLVLVKKRVDQAWYDNARLLRNRPSISLKRSPSRSASAYPLSQNIIKGDVDHLLGELSPVLRGPLELRAWEPLGNVANL